jgi:hypothetical protein
VTGEVVTSTIMNTDVRDNFNAVADVGDYKFKAALSAGAGVENVIDGGWLECNGPLLSRTTYSVLFAYLNGLGLPFGAGDGSTTFGGPDFRGRAFWHIGSHADVNALGLNDGGADASRSAIHDHTVIDPGHSHTFDGWTVHTVGTAQGYGGGGGDGVPDATGTRTATTGITVGASGRLRDRVGFEVGGIICIKF